MDIQAVMISGELCKGSRFQLHTMKPHIGDVIVFGGLVSGFVTLARTDLIRVDIGTASIACQPVAGAAGSSGLTWEVSGVLAPPEPAS